LLVNFRRIVHRGLVNFSGELWYREGLPSEVFRRLVVRKENETPLDRFSGDYEELMTYANFRDLADIIVGNDVLKDRLTILEPRDGASLLDRLHQLEEIRRGISTGSPASDEDAARLQGYFEEFRSAIKGGKRPESDAEISAAAGQGAAGGTLTPAEEETLESIFEPEETPPPARAKPRGRLKIKISQGNLHKNLETSSEPASEPAKPAIEEPVVPAPPVASDVGSVETPVTEVSKRPRGAADDDGGVLDELETIERALRDEDHGTILKALHVEVTEIADGMLRRDPKQGHLVWELVGRHGWFESHRDEFRLQPLERFYGLADRFLDAYSSNAKSSDLKEMLSDAGFSKLLLEMREMFMESRARA
jgi:hypothetical protein